MVGGPDQSNFLGKEFGGEARMGQRVEPTSDKGQSLLEAMFTRYEKKKLPETITTKAATVLRAFQKQIEQFADGQGVDLTTFGSQLYLEDVVELVQDTLGTEANVRAIKAEDVQWWEQRKPDIIRVGKFRFVVTTEVPQQGSAQVTLSYRSEDDPWEQPKPQPSVWRRGATAT